MSTVKKSFRCAICGATHQQSRGPICPNLKCELPIFCDFLRRFDEHHESFTSNNSASVRRIFAFLHAHSDSYTEWARTNPEAIMPPESLKALHDYNDAKRVCKNTIVDGVIGSVPPSTTTTTSFRLEGNSGGHRLPLPTPPPTVVQAFRLGGGGAGGAGGGAASRPVVAAAPQAPQAPPPTTPAAGVGGDSIKGPAPPVLNCELLCRARKVDRIVLDPKDFRF